MQNYLNKYKKLLSIILIVAVAVLMKSYVYDKMIIDIENYKLKNALEESAKSSDPFDAKYQHMPIKNQYKVVFVATPGGEYSYAKDFKYAAERMGWQVKIYYKQIDTHEQEILDFDPDFILYGLFTEHSIISPELNAHRSKKYLSNHMIIPAVMLLWDRPLKEVNEWASKMIAPFHGIIVMQQELDFFKKEFIKLNKIFNGVGTLPSAPALLNEPAEPQHLTWGGWNWDKLRSSDKYKQFIKRLSENVPMKINGPYLPLSQFSTKVYDGLTPCGIEHIEAIRNNGIYLLTHANMFLDSGITTSRIFEALAANVIIISDMHPFAIENFGDNFLYFDQTADSETMYKQVKAHMDWILANPEKAKAMAARAHQIFLDKFAMEKDLIKIAKMHEFILKQEKEMGLRYPLAY